MIEWEDAVPVFESGVTGLYLVGYAPLRRAVEAEDDIGATTIKVDRPGVSVARLTQPYGEVDRQGVAIVRQAQVGVPIGFIESEDMLTPASSPHPLRDAWKTLCIIVPVVYPIRAMDLPGFVHAADQGSYDEELANAMMGDVGDGSGPAP